MWVSGASTVPLTSSSPHLKWRWGLPYETLFCATWLSHLSLIESQYHVMHHFTCTSSHFIYCISRGMLNLYWGNWKIFEDKVWWASACSHSSNQANQPVAGHFNNGNHSVSDMKIRNPLSHFWKLCIVAAKDMKCASFLNVALSTLLALLGTFFRLTISIFACEKPTLTLLQILTLFHFCFIYFFVYCCSFLYIF